MSYMDRFASPSREEIAGRVLAEQPPAGPPAEGAPEVPVTKREQLQQAEDGVLAWFSAHARVALRLRGWSKLDLARAAGSQGADVTRAVNGQACSLSMAGRIAAALGKNLADMVQPLKCETYAGSPPPGFACLECASETPRSAA